MTSSSFVPKISNSSMPLSFKVNASSGLIAGSKCFSVLSSDVSMVFSIGSDGGVGCGLGLSIWIEVFSFYFLGVIVDIFLVTFW